MTSTETIDQETTIAVDPVERAVAREIELRLGSGRALLDAETGSPLQFVDDTAPERTYLLDGRTPWHSLEHAWGSGHVVADTFAGRWNAPHELEMDGDVVRAAYKVGPLVVDVERRGGNLLQETYRFRNTSDSTIRITGLAVQTPFADLYPGALDALTRRVHAHVFTGGRWAWVAAQPMDGRGHVLGLRVTEGELWSYSVETRNANTISNARGHLVLNVTDRARNPDAFGGQPALALDAGAEYVLGWELGWHSDIASFIEATHAPAEFSALAATVGEPISIRTPCEVRAAGGVEVVTEPGGARITARVHGLYAIRLGDGARSEVLFHDSVADAVRKRAEFVIRYQLGRERPGLLSHAILPVDTRTRLTQLTNGWSDWTDGSERIGAAEIVRAELTLMLATLCQDHEAEFAELSRTLPVVGRDSGHMRRIAEFIGENYTRGPSLDEAAAAARLSKSRLCALIRQYTGTSFQVLIREMRIEDARERLVLTDDTIGQIAYRVGYNDEKYFLRAFKSSAGMTPTAYRLKRAKEDRAATAERKP